MSKPIDELVVQIKADTKQLQKDLKKVQTKLKTTGAVGGAAFGGIAGALSKIKIGAVAVVAAIAMVGTTISKIAKIGMVFEDLNDSLNTVFGSIEAGEDAMQKILTFSQKTPFQIETTTKAFIALKSAGIEPSNRMLQVFADTASTSTDQLGVFEALVRTVQRSASGGLGLEELNMIMDRGIDVLGILNDELGLSKDEIAKFGATAEGAKLITDALINGLEKKFGGAMESKMDNLSTKASNMTIAFKNLANDIFTSGLDEQLKGLTDRITKFLEKVLEARKAARTETGVALTDDVTINIDKLEARRDELEQSLNKLRSEAESQLAIGGVAQGSDEFTSYEDSVANLESSLKAVNNELTIQNQELVEQAQNFKNSSNSQDNLNESQKNGIMRQGELLNSATFLANEIKKLKGNTDQLTFANENLEDIFKNNKKLFDDLGVTFDELEGYLLEIMGGVDNTTDSIENLNDSIEPLVDILDDELKQAIVNSSNAFTTDFVNALLDGENGLQSFKDFSKSLVAQIISIFMQLMVVNKILNSIFNLGLPEASFFGDGSEAKALQFEPEIDLSHLTPNLGGAGGGAMFSGQPRLVGERGAEIFVPHTSGTLLNNMNSKNAMSAGKSVNIYQTVNFATGIVPTVRAEVTKMMPQIADVTKAAVQESAMRGGNFRRSLVGG